MISRFRRFEFGTGSEPRKGCVRYGFCPISRNVPDASLQPARCAFMTKPTLASRRVRGLSSAGEETVSAELSWLLGSRFL